eukprot:10276809-Karenia_brevis.AAC.1
MSYDIATNILPSLHGIVPMSYDVGTDILQPQPGVRTMSYDMGSDFWDIGSRSVGQGPFM